MGGACNQIVLASSTKSLWRLAFGFVIAKQNYSSYDCDYSQRSDADKKFALSGHFLIPDFTTTAIKMLIVAKATNDSRGIVINPKYIIWIALQDPKASQETGVI